MTTQNVAMNAAEITMELPSSCIGSAAFVLLDSIASAAIGMAAIEAETDFNWEDAGTDWESACAVVARELDALRGKPLPMERLREIIIEGQGVRQ